jgi:hypothetical protein
MRPVIQAEVTGCGIASVAAIAGVSYASAKKIANRFGIYAKTKSYGPKLLTCAAF